MRLWIGVLVILAVVLVLAWAYDRRHRVRTGGIPGPEGDPGVTAALAERGHRPDVGPSNTH